MPDGLPVAQMLSMVIAALTATPPEPSPTAGGVGGEGGGS